jgi:hypothetical protein
VGLKQEMVMFPVVRITRPFMGGAPVVFHAAMIYCSDEASAIAAFPKEPGDKVEFAWWDVAHPPLDLPQAI